MVDIPEDLLRRSAEAEAKARGVSVEEVIAEMRGEKPRWVAPIPEPQPEPEPVAEVAEPEPDQPAQVEVESDMEQDVAPEVPKVAEPVDEPVPATEPADVAEPDNVEIIAIPAPAEEPADAPAGAAMAEPVATAVAVEDRPAPETPVPDSNGNGSGNGNANGNGNGKVAGLVTPRPVVPPAGLPDGVRTQRLLTVVKARAIQNVKPEPSDKVNTWPHLMLMEFGALLGITALLVLMAVIIHSPLLDPANVNATPNPSKAPWYFLGLQELLSYFDPQIAGVMIPGFAGLIGLMMVPYVDKNPSTRPSDRKFAIALYSVFLAGSAALTIIGVLFRGMGFNFTYPWRDGVFFDDLLDWVNFH